MTTRYRRGVLSRYLAWAYGLPGHGWWLYPAIAVVLFLWSHGIVWATGQVPVGSIHPLLAVGLIYPPYTLAAIAYLDRWSGRALATFWPATGWPDEERPAWRARFLASPARWDRVLVLAGVALAILAFAGAAPASLAGADRTILFIAYLVPGILGYVCVLLAFAHSVHQLRLVDRIHREATAIDPFDRASLYAFSSLTARTGIAYVVSGYYTLVFNAAFQSGNAFALTVLVSVFVLGIACFVLPLWGIHDRLVHEKGILMRGVELRAGRLGAELYRRIDGGEFEATKVVSDSIVGVGDLRKRVADVPTWPWRPQALSGFLSALLLPVAVYLITRTIANQLGS